MFVIEPRLAYSVPTAMRRATNIGVKMKKLVLGALNYSEALMFATTKDEQDLIAILSRATVVKEDWQNHYWFKTDGVPNVKYLNSEDIEECERVKENEDETV